MGDKLFFKVIVYTDKGEWYNKASIADIYH
jgi:hypothetical protein